MTCNLGGLDLVSAGAQDIFVAKYDSAGDHAWSQRFGDTLADHGSAVATDGADGVLITGTFQGTVDLGGGVLTSAAGKDGFVAKLAP